MGISGDETEWPLGGTQSGCVNRTGGSIKSSPDSLVSSPEIPICTGIQPDAGPAPNAATAPNGNGQVYFAAASSLPNSDAVPIAIRI